MTECGWAHCAASLKCFLANCGRAAWRRPDTHPTHLTWYQRTFAFSGIKHALERFQDADTIKEYLTAEINAVHLDALYDRVVTSREMQQDCTQCGPLTGVLYCHFFLIHDTTCSQGPNWLFYSDLNCYVVYLLRASPNGSACFILAPHSWGFEVTHNDAPQSAGLRWSRGQLVTETATWQHTTVTTHNSHNTQQSQHTTVTTHSSHNTQQSQHTTVTTHSSHNTQQSQHTAVTTHNSHNTQQSQHTTVTTHNSHNTQQSQHTTVTTHNNHNTQTSMPPVGFEPKISAGERPQTYNLDRAATETGN